jgi:hypothetical protein
MNIFYSLVGFVFALISGIGRKTLLEEDMSQVEIEDELASIFVQQGFLCQIRGDINAASNCYEKIIAAK